MKVTGNTSYDYLIEDIIRNECKKKKIDFSAFMTPEEQNAIFSYLSTKIQKHPGIFDHFHNVKVRIPDASNLLESQILAYLSKAHKGTAFFWTDDNGIDHLYLNTGKDSREKKKIIEVIQKENDEKKGRKQKIRQMLIPALIIHDVKRVFRKIQQEEIEKSKKNRKSSVITSLFIKGNKEVKKPDWSAKGTFEKEFKKEVKRAGFGVSPVSICKRMFDPISGINGNDKKIIYNSLLSMGIKSDSDLSSLLNKWKEEALHESPKRTLSRDKSIGMSL